MSNGNGTSTVKTWKLYLGVFLIIIQFFAFGFYLISDRATFKNEIADDTRRITVIESQLKGIASNKSVLLELIHNVKLLMKKDGITWEPLDVTNGH